MIALCLACAVPLSAQQASPEPAASPTPTPASPTAATKTPERTTKISGYLQARGTWSDTASPETNLSVRRARVNVRHTNGRFRLAISVDGGQNDVVVRDAFLDWDLASGGERGGEGVTLKLGQFFRPFGQEIEHTAPARELPERPAGWAVLFPGNRDQGVRVSAGFGARLAADVAVLNGNGTSSSFRDADDHKDVILRARLSAADGRLEAAASLYRGRQVIAATSSEPSLEGDRNRAGLAMTAKTPGRGVVRAEWVEARDLTLNRGAGPARITAPARAWFAQYTHPLGGEWSLTGRYDLFDPDTDDEARPDGDGEVRTWGAALMRKVGKDLSITGSCERAETTRSGSGRSSTASETRATLQVQYRF